MACEIARPWSATVGDAGQPELSPACLLSVLLQYRHDCVLHLLTLGNLGTRTAVVPGISQRGEEEKAVGCYRTGEGVIL